MPGVYFDERIAQRYEAYWPHLFEPAAIEEVVSFLADLAGGGSALEFGVGTGPDGAPGRDDPARALEQLAARAVHR
jgi:hypothetical protein